MSRSSKYKDSLRILSKQNRKRKAVKHHIYYVVNRRMRTGKWIMDFYSVEELQHVQRTSSEYTYKVLFEGTKIECLGWIWLFKKLTSKKF